MMPRKGNCGKCGKYGKITWANYVPYCPACLAEKSKNAIPFEEALFPEEFLKEEIKKIKKRLDKLEGKV